MATDLVMNSEYFINSTMLCVKNTFTWYLSDLPNWFLHQAKVAFMPSRFLVRNSIWTS